MTGYLVTYEQETYELPPFCSARLLRTASVPCDSFSVQCVFSAVWDTRLQKAVRFYVKEKGELLFYGVVDEIEFSLSTQGTLLSIQGRGLASLLLDNEVPAAVFQQTSLQQLLQSYASPLGIQSQSLPALLSHAPYTIASGSSVWRVLSQFTQQFGGWTPAFTVEGRLYRPNDTAPLLWDDSVPFLQVSWREKRYGLLSELQLVQKKTGAVQTICHESFRQEGGCSRKVQYYTGDTASACRSAKESLANSAVERRSCEWLLPSALAIEPLQLLRLQRKEGWQGLFRVQQVERLLDANGERTKFYLQEVSASCG